MDVYDTFKDYGYDICATKGMAGCAIEGRDDESAVEGYKIAVYY